MNSPMEKYENGWFLSVIRSNPVKWFLLSPEKAQSLNMMGDMDDFDAIKFKDAQPLIRKSYLLMSSPSKNRMGLPDISVYVHKNIAAAA